MTHSNRRHLKFIFAPAVVLAQTLICTATFAVAPQDEALCLGKGPDVELSIAACTRIGQTPGIADSKRAAALATKGYLLVAKQHSFDEAIQTLDEAIRLRPSDTSSLFFRGQAHQGKGEFDLAIRDFTESIRLAPEYVPALDARGSTWRLKGDFPHATADFEAALRVSHGQKSARIE